LGEPVEELCGSMVRRTRRLCARRRSGKRQEDVAVIPRSRHWLTAALGLSLGLAGSGRAADPVPAIAPLPATASANQRMADTIADRLRDSGQLHGFALDIGFDQGVVEVSGRVANRAQHDAALRIVQGVAGVEHVVDRVEVGAGQANPADVVPVRAEEQPPSRLPQPLPTAPAVPPPSSAAPAPAPPPGAPPAGAAAPEAVPSFQAPPPSPYDLNHPRMPPYAWPTYAPYNNYSRVGYPLAYPYNAWPFIGPCYPFPKIPPGWRCVKLEWEDGYWWFSKLMTKYDWWRLRYY
jgi:hypothetical protein